MCRPRSAGTRRHAWLAWNTLAVIALLAVGACDDGPGAPTSPMAPTPPTNPPSSLTVTVIVEEYRGTWQRLAGVTVDALLASLPTSNATTDANGKCELTLPAGQTTIRATKDGYEPESTTVDVAGATRTVYFRLYRTTVRGELAGHYTLTVTVSPSCSNLPEPAREQAYDAHVVTDGNSVHVLLGPNDRMVAWAGESGFRGTREGDAVKFVITDDLFGDYCFIADIPGVGDLYHSGEANGVFRDDTIVASFNGWIGLSPSSRATSTTSCQASDHQLVFRR